MATRWRDFEPEERFHRQVKGSSRQGCWIWGGHLNHKGYGKFRYGGKKMFAHRAAFQMFSGEIGDKFVLHKCDTPACVNPQHLFLGTGTDNMRDMSDKGRASGQKKTHCAQGHLFDTVTTYEFLAKGRYSPKRACKICISNRHYSRKRAMDGISS